MNNKQTLRDRLIARNSGPATEMPVIAIPATGRIDGDTVVIINHLAHAGSRGDRSARDQLWFAFRPRLERVGVILKPWPNSATMTGIWERDDVRQESWIVFAELLSVWSGEVNFVPYLLSRFPWRLRDRILRGIGKPQTQFGTFRVSEAMIDNLVYAGEDEEPESNAMARRLLEELLHRYTKGRVAMGELDAWVALVNAHQSHALSSPQVDSMKTLPGTESLVG